MRHRSRTLIITLVVIAACGVNGDTGRGGISSPCDLADADQVQAAFGGTVALGVEGEARNCTFDIVGGPVISVSVFEFGNADRWEPTRQGFVDNLGGVTDVEGMGDAAFFPNDSGPMALVVQSGGQIFEVSVFTGFEEPTPEVIEAVAELAQTIAEDLAS